MIESFHPGRYIRPTVLLLACFAFTGCGGGTAPGAAEANVAAIPSLIQSLKQRDPTARSRAAIALGKMGPEAKEAVPALTAALKDRDVSVKAAAAHALGKIGPDAKGALDELQKLAKQPALREVATEAVKQIGP
jgi:HEAT repeat protein